MKASFNRLILFIYCSCFTSFLVAQDTPALLQDSSLNAKIAKNALKNDTSFIKNDTVKKAAAADADSTAPTPSHFQISLTWQSNDVNNGRKDSSVIPLITPEISYLFKSGFEIDLSVGYNTHEPSPQVNQYTLDGSYSFNPGNYSGSVTVSAFYYSKLSGSTKSAQKGNIEYDNSYDFNFIEPSLNLTYTFNSGLPDYQASFALQHQYSIGNLSITPTATMNAATQNGYNEYYQNRRFTIPRNDGKPPLPENVSLTGEVLNSDKFQILDYELSLPISFTAGKWTFSTTPVYALPINPADIKATLRVNNNMTSYTYKETLPNVFYISFAVTYAF